MTKLLLTLPAFLAFSFVATANPSSTQTDTSVWKNVDKSLTEGAQTFKKKLMDADVKKEPEKMPVKKDGWDKAADGLNSAWDSVLHGVGSVLKTQKTDDKVSATKDSERK